MEIYEPNINPISKQVYKEVLESGLIGRNQLNILAYFMEYGANTARELLTFMDTENVTFTNIRARCIELEERKCLIRYDKRECNVTGRIATVWKWNGKSPSVRIKKKRKIDIAYQKGYEDGLKAAKESQSKQMHF